MCLVIKINQKLPLNNLHYLNTVACHKLLSTNGQLYTSNLGLLQICCRTLQEVSKSFGGSFEFSEDRTSSRNKKRGMCIGGGSRKQDALLIDDLLI